MQKVEKDWSDCMNLFSAVTDVRLQTDREREGEREGRREREGRGERDEETSG